MIFPIVSSGRASRGVTQFHTRPRRHIGRIGDIGAGIGVRIEAGRSGHSKIVLSRSSSRRSACTAERTGTVINFGSLGGETSDIRLFPPRSLTLKGVVLGSQPPEQRKADLALAQRLAHEPGTLFEVAERYSPSRIADAVAHVSQAGRTGVVLIDFSKD
jgi:hypothetical protein